MPKYLIILPIVAELHMTIEAESPERAAEEAFLTYDVTDLNQLTNIYAELRHIRVIDTEDRTRAWSVYLEGLDPFSGV